MAELDDLEAIAKLDSEDVLGAVERFPEQCREAWELGRATTNLPNGDGIDAIVVLGMGGSGVSGDVVQAVVEPRLAVPFRTIKSYGPIPDWVGRNTLVFAVSYSGSTEETLAGLETALERGARIITLSSGGPLAATAASKGLAHVAIPAGLQPRASLGYLSLPILAVLTLMELVPDVQADVDEAIKVLSELASRCHRERTLRDNPAKDLAARIKGRIPVVYGGHGVGATAAYRFKCDLNEYGKTPAFWNEIPELDHNEIVGWDNLDDLTSERFVAILLREPGEHERVALRFEITRRLVESRLAEFVEVTSEGESALARLLSLVFVTQLASIYVGLAYDEDPGPVDVIMQLKQELKDR
ncbi:MAG: glucose/mannose-6-phosphate isomerase [Actinomycetota bacterium]|jgi:glucose/mannose-6-phosphate isomerase|nr:glucose/mannose-6-phosphate isomerase [Actinomycetota bacterium]